jgi:hypothetical protein
VYWPALLPADLVQARVLIDGEQVWAGPARLQPPGDGEAAPPGPASDQPASDQPASDQQRPAGDRPGAPSDQPDPAARDRSSATAATLRMPLGAVMGARSGDKGGNANVGVWARTPEVYAWLEEYLTADRLAELLPQLSGLAIERHRLPNLLALNFVVAGLLGRGVAASTRMDAQAKALGEELRAAPADIPAGLLAQT